MPGIDCSRLCGKFRGAGRGERKDIKGLLEEIKGDAKFETFNTVQGKRKKGGGGTVETIVSSVIGEGAGKKKVEKEVKSPSAVRLCTRFGTDPGVWNTDSGSL